MTPPSPRRLRRGNYAMMLFLCMAALLGFGALAIDTNYVLLAQSEAQDVADAASAAALIMLRETGDRDEARRAAEDIIAANRIMGVAPEMLDIEFGSWNDAEADPWFDGDSTRPNAVRVTVGRVDDNAIPRLMSRMWDNEPWDIAARSTSATRSTQVIIVLDITGSWGEGPFADAREAVILALDTLVRTSHGVDEIGMTIFTNRFAWEYTPFTNIADPDLAAEVAADWSLLNIASKAGTNASPYDGRDCTLNGNPNTNNFNAPAGGCYPDMPREYRDEPGTDHSTGIRLAKAMFEEHTNGAAYRAMIILTDGRPNGLGAASGTTRDAQGYEEERWREYRGPVPRTIQQIRDASINATDILWDNLNVHTWVISLIADDPMMPAMTQGDGYYVRTTNTAQLSAVLGQIVREMPMAIVE